MTLFFALILEALVGDPSNRWHPVAWLGLWISRVEAWLYAPTRRAGVLAWLWVVSVVCSLAYWGHMLFGSIFDVLLLWLSMGWRSLFEHVQAVLQTDDIQQARMGVSRIVSRDTAEMSLEDCRRAALESLAENASDAVVAPLFWFALLGPVGAFIYRTINTLDAMWGYRNQHYEYFGWLAAKADDVVNYLPARMTAWSLLWAGNPVPWSQVRAQAATHASPNAGYPEVALAFAAHIRLGGSVMRLGQVDARPDYGAEDAEALNHHAVSRAVRVVARALSMVLVSVVILEVLF